jgi:NDP-sugar pyrophosphorylase family protein
MSVAQTLNNVTVETHANISKPLMAELDKTNKERNLITIRDSESGQSIATLSQSPDSTIKVHFLKAKGGVFSIVHTTRLVYLLLPGSQLQLPGLLLNMSGELPAGRLNPGSSNQQQFTAQAVTDQAMILGAGLASRFVPVSGDLTGFAKPSVPLIGNDSVIVTLAKHLYRHGIRKLLVNTFYMPDILKAQLDSLGDIQITYIDEDKPSGTAGGLLKAIDSGLLDMTKPILIMQGDAVTDADLSALLSTHQDKQSLATIGVKHVQDDEVSQMAIVITDQSGPDGESGYVLSFREKPTLAEAGDNRLASIGFYVLSPQVLADFSRIGKVHWDQSGEYDYAFHFFPALIEEHPGSLYAHMLAQPFYWSDIGRPDQYLATVRDIYEGKVRLALPENASQYFTHGVVYWDDAQQLAALEDAEPTGNMIVFKRRKIT